MLTERWRVSPGDKESALAREEEMMVSLSCSGG